MKAQLIYVCVMCMYMCVYIYIYFFGLCLQNFKIVKRTIAMSSIIWLNSSFCSLK